MDKKEFKAKWETEDGGGITFDDIAETALTIVLQQIQKKSL